MSNLDMDLSLFRPVYSPKDFLEVLSQLHSPNHVQHSVSQLGKPFGLIQVQLVSSLKNHHSLIEHYQVPLKTASLDDLIERFAELSRADPHLGVNPGAPSGDDPSLTLEQERYQLGVKVLDMDHAPLSQEYLKRGCPHSIRGSVWAQVPCKLDFIKMNHFLSCRFSVVR